jgi:mono/diheme cytochrome c family protein
MSLLLAASAGAQRSSATEGRELFIANGCYQCHGYEGQGGEALRIAPSLYPFEAFAQMVRRPSLEMPAYSPDVLTEEDLRSIYEYVRSIPEPPSVADLPALQDD